MASQYATGSVHVFAEGPGTGKFYLGTCERMPQDTREPQYELLMNDFSGSKVPLDLSWQGEQANVSCILTRYSERGFQLLETKPRPTVNANGSWDYGDVGALMALEGLAWQLWLAYTFGAALLGRAAYVANPAGVLPPGRFYPQCVVWSPQTEETGTKPMKRHVVFYAWPELTISGSSKKYQLYSTVLADFVGINSTLIV